MHRRLAVLLVAAIACAVWAQPAAARWTHPRLLPRGSGPVTLAVAPSGALAVAYAASEIDAGRLVRIVPGHSLAKTPLPPVPQGSVLPQPQLGVSSRGRVVVAAPSLKHRAMQHRALRALLWEPSGRRRQQTLDARLGYYGWVGRAVAAMAPDGTATIAWNRLGERSVYAATARPGHRFAAPQVVDGDGLLYDLRVVRGHESLLTLLRGPDTVFVEIRVAAGDRRGRFDPSRAILELGDDPAPSVATSATGAQLVGWEAVASGVPHQPRIADRAPDAAAAQAEPPGAVDFFADELALSSTGRAYAFWFGRDDFSLYAATRAPGASRWARLGRVARDVEGFNFAVDDRGDAFVATERVRGGYSHTVEAIAVARPGKRFLRPHRLGAGRCLLADVKSAGRRTAVAWACGTRTYVSRYRP